VLEGVRMTRDQLAALLASEGVEEIPTEGAFDPHVHEALASQPGGEGIESGAVLQVIQRGYRMGDTVVRPARVVVAE
jgi:molecular chaperone GrpE